MRDRQRVELKSDALVAARRFAAALDAEGEDMSPSERVVLTRALRHQLDLAFRELGIVDLASAGPATAPSSLEDVPGRRVPAEG